MIITASLRTYLTVILSRRIIDANRKFGRQNNSRIAFEEQEKMKYQTKILFNSHPRII